MKRYRSRVKGPLPIRLKSGSISVASKGYFSVEDEDLLSSGLLTEIRKKNVEEVDENGRRVVPPKEEPKKESKEESKPEIEAPQDVIDDEKDDDSLTSSLEMVESGDEKTDSDDASSTDGKKKNKKGKSTGSKSKKQKGISG